MKKTNTRNRTLWFAVALWTVALILATMASCVHFAEDGEITTEIITGGDQPATTVAGTSAEPDTQSGTQGGTESDTQSFTETSAGAATEILTLAPPDPVTDPTDDPVTDPDGDPVTDPADDPVTDPDGDPVTDPDGDPVTDPDGDPVTEPETDPVTEPVPETVPETEPPFLVEDWSCIGKSYDTFLVNGEMYFAEDGGADAKLAMIGNTVTFGAGEECFSIALRGWIGYDCPIARFGYFINARDIVYGDFHADTENAVLAAGGPHARRFMITVPMDDLGVGSYMIGFVAELEDGTVVRLYETLTIVILGGASEEGPVVTDPSSDSTAEPEPEPWPGYDETTIVLAEFVGTNEAHNWLLSKSFGQRFNIGEYALQQLYIPHLATFCDNVNSWVLKIWQWDTNYATTVAGEVLYEVSGSDHYDHDDLVLDILAYKAITGEIYYELYYSAGSAALTGWVAGEAAEGLVTYVDGAPAQKHFASSIVVIHPDSPDPELGNPSEPDTDAPGGTTSPSEPAGSSQYEGVLIHSVYGPGKKGAEALISNGYIQLYNKSNKDIALTGAALYYKTDNDDPFEQFVFPAGAIIPAGGYYLVRTLSPSGFDPENAVMKVEYCDAEWDVYLDNKEIRLLLAPAGWQIPRDADVTTYTDAISCFVATMEYHSSVYALYDLSRNKIAVRTAMEAYSGYHTVNMTRASTPTLMDLRTRTSNGTVNEVKSSMINEIVFGYDAGIYDSAILLSLSAQPGYTIYYTTDGSDPSLSTNRSRKRYSESIPLGNTDSMSWGAVTRAAANLWGSPSASTQIGGHVIKAYATNGTDSTAVFTNTYFITEDLTKYGVTVMSISMPLNEIMGSNGFYENFLTEPGNITGGRNRGVGIMELFDTTGDRVGNSRVEMAVSGNGSSGWGMKSLRIYIKGANNKDAGLQSDLNYDIFGGEAKDAWGQAITSFSRLMIRNSGNDCGTSYIRDAFMQSTAAGLNVDYMESASTLVFINGEFWGVYNLRERYSPEYVESHYGVNKDNVTVIESDYSQVHTNTNADFVLSSGVEGDQDPFNEMVQFMRTHNLSNQANYDYVASLMDIDSFIDMWVVRLFYVARDWPENNIKVWRNKNPDDPSGFDTKWHFTLLDLDMGLSFYDFTTERENFMWAFDSGSVCGTMMRSLLQNPGFKQKFIARYYDVVITHMNPDDLNAIFEELYAERDPLMSLQQGRWHSDASFTYSKWLTECEKIRTFINERRPYAVEHFQGRFGVAPDDIGDLGQQIDRKITVSFHSDRMDVTIGGDPVQNGAVIQSKSGTPGLMHVVATAREGYVVTAILFTDKNGIVHRIEGNEGRLRLEQSGTLSFSVQRMVADPDAFKNATIVSGGTYLFYLTGNGDLYAWGDNRHGVLGLGSSSSVVNTPTLVMRGVAKVVTSAGNDLENEDHTFSTAILTVDGRLFTVGVNSCGQLCRNGTTEDNNLGEVALNFRVKDISMGHDHLLIVDEDGNLWGIGSNSYGALGSTNVGGNVTTLVKLATDVAFASAGRRSTVYVKNDGSLWGLGDNRWQKLSRDHGDVISSPIKMADNIVFVDSGEHQILAVDASGNLYYAGWRTLNGFGQGGGNNPTVAYMMGNVKKADIYFGNMVALTKDGKAYIYGLNTENALGASYTDGTPRQILEGVLDVAAGYDFTAYLMEDGTLLVQGSNAYGQAGNGAAGGSVSLSAIDLPA